MSYARPPIEERFWSQVSPCPNTGCWWWEGPKALMQDYSSMKVSHIALMLHGRPRPSDDAMVNHHCDSPLCVNPDHLYWTTRDKGKGQFIAEPVECRFRKYVSPCPNTGCWLWDGTVQKGYGAFKALGTQKATHVALTLDGRPRPHPKAIACHHCDVPLCVNPDHLYWGDNSTNQKDAHRRGRRDRVPPGLLARQKMKHRGPRRKPVA